MYLRLKNILLHNAILKCSSFIIGCIIWYSISQTHLKTVVTTIPICFYNIPAQMNITAPDCITVQLRGKRCDLDLLDYNSLALHLNAARYHEGPHRIAVSAQALFLPDQINVIHYSPSNGIISVQSKKPTDTA